MEKTLYYVKVIHHNEAYYVCKVDDEDVYRLLHQDVCDDYLTFKSKQAAKAFAHKNYSVNDNEQFPNAPFLQILNYEIWEITTLCKKTT